MVSAICGKAGASLISVFTDAVSIARPDPADLGGSLPGWAEQADKYGVASVLSVPLPGAEPAAARAVISQAGGVSDTEAFSYLARRSAREGRSILDVARDVLATAARPAGQELRS